MGKRITSVSFETIGVQVVTVRLQGSSVTVERALTLQTDEFEAFLSVDSDTEYLVAINPADAIYETIQIPPVDAKFEGTLIKAEAARQNPELGSFSCAYQLTGESPSKGKTVRKASCCLVSHTTIFSYLEPFIRQNKTIQKIVALPHILATLAGTQQELSQEPILCAHDGGQSKTLFLLDSGAVVFSRSIASNGYGWDPFDRQNISMTLDYCFQALRIRAHRVLVLNLQQEADPDQPFPRLERLAPPDWLSGLNPDILMTTLVPLSLATSQLQQTCDLLPDQYRSEKFKQGLYRAGSVIYAVILLMLLVATGVQLYEISALSQSIETIKAAESHLAESVQQHQALTATQNTLQPLLTSWNQTMTSADIPHTLVAIDRLGQDFINHKTVTLKRNADTITLLLSGTVTGTGFASTQERFETYIATLQGVRGMQVSRKQIDPKGQQFTVEAVYKP